MRRVLEDIEDGILYGCMISAFGVLLYYRCMM